MTTSCVAVLTFNRRPVLETSLAGVLRFSEPETRVGVFEDAGYFDDTEGLLTKSRTAMKQNAFTREIEAVEWAADLTRPEIFMGTRNLGVAGNSNRAIHWFLNHTSADHLCLCNDDILPQGDFVSIYRKAHDKLGVGLLCLMPFESEDYKPSVVVYRGQRIKLCPRMTGMMMSITRECLLDVGYFDMTFKKFGQEHCDWTNRARFMGHLNLDNHPQGQIDIVQDCVTYQDAETSVKGRERAVQDALAEVALGKVMEKYKVEGTYKPFATERPDYVGLSVPEAGISYDAIKDSYALVTDRSPWFND